jgi:hypothetical protein
MRAADRVWNRTPGATAAVATAALTLALCASTPAGASDTPSWLAYAAVPRVDAGPLVRPRGPSSLSKPSVVEEHEKLDTEHIFGITMGSDIGEKGEFELELETFSGIGKRSGTYFTTATHTHFKYTVTDTLRIAPGFTFGSHRIENVPDLDNHSEADIHEASVEIRWKVLDRHTQPFGLTLNFEPTWSRLDDITGRQITGYGSVVSALMDKEIIPDKLYGAFNFGYVGGASRLRSTGEWSYDSDVTIQGAVSWQFAPLTLIGVEVRYLRAYEGLATDHLKGEALYVGPTFHIMLSKLIGLSGTWNVQAAGKAVGDPSSLDLVNFERNQVLLRLTAHF